jgi:hypothetical protein
MYGLPVKRDTLPIEHFVPRPLVSRVAKSHFWPTVLLATILCLYIVPAGGAPTWENIGPDGGDQFMIRISPQDPDTLFLTAHSSVHRSRDRGETWTPVHVPDMARGTLHDLVFSPTNANELFVCSLVDGVWYSPDEGKSWEQRSEGLPSLIEELGLFYPLATLGFDYQGRLYAGVSESLTGEVPPHWIYGSTDGGLNWSDWDAEITVPGTELTQRVSALLSKDADDELWAMVYGSGVSICSNGTWNARNGDLPAAALRGTFLAHDAQDADRLLLATEDDWVYESTNGGASWARLPLPNELVSAEVFPMAFTIAIDPNNQELIWVHAHSSIGSTELPLFAPGPDQNMWGGKYWSEDGGDTWIRDIYQHAFRIAVDSSVTTNVNGIARSRDWYVTAGALLSFMKSEDGAQTFTKNIAGIRTGLINTLWVPPPGTMGLTNAVFAGTEEGLFYTTNQSPDWAFTKSVDFVSYTWSFAPNPTDPNAFLYSTGNPAWSFPWVRGVYGADLSDFETNIVAPTNQLMSGLGVWRVVTTTNRPDHIYAGAQSAGLWVSTNAGVDWATYSPGLGVLSVTDVKLDTDGEPKFASVRTSSGNPSAPEPQSWIPLPRELGGVFRRDDTNWTAIPGVISAVVELNQVDPTGRLYAATANGMYRSDPPWTNLVSCSPAQVVYDMVVHPNEEDWLYAATPLTVYRSTNGGNQWHELSDGLTMTRVYTLAMDPATEILYAGTGGNSVFILRPDPNPQPVMGLSATNIDFGLVPVGPGYFQDMPLLLVNEGEADLVVTNYSTSSAFPVYYNFQALSAALPKTISPGSWLHLVVRFSPLAAGPAQTDILFYGDAANSPVSVTVSGDGYTSKGHLRVDVSVSNAIWTADRPWGGTVLKVGDFETPGIGWPTGVYTIKWQDVEGYYTPTNSPVLAPILEEATTDVAGVYISLTLDTDGDGMFDWEEIVAGTDPANPASLFSMTDLMVEPPPSGSFVLTWTSTSNRAYTVERCTNFCHSFMVLDSGIPATPPMNVHTDSAAGIQSFYRVLVD